MSNVTRRLDIFGLVTDIQPRMANILESVAKDKRERIPSGFIYDVKNLGIIEELDINAEGRNSNSKKCIAVDNNSNAIAFSGDSEILYVDGYKVVMESDPSKFNNTIVALNENPLNGSQLEYVFMEVWKEYVDVDSDDAVFFPYGNTQYKADGTYDDCQLLNANRSGNGAPAYLIDSDKHGYYVSVKDEHIDKFMANPNNNIGVDNNYKLFQVRYRIRVVNVNNVDMIHAYEDSTIKAQGKLSNPSAISFNNVESDAGLSLANNVALSDDSKVRSIPLALISKRNTSEFSIKNMNGSINRLDSKTINVGIDDVIDLRCHIIEGNIFNFKRMINSNLDLAFKSELDTVMEPLMMDPAGVEMYNDTGIRSKKLLRADMAIGNIAALEGDWQVIAKSKGDNGINGKFDGLRAMYSNMASSQTLTCLVQSMSSTTINPNTNVFSYDSNAHSFIVDARLLNSGSNYNAGNENVTKVSASTPVVTMNNYISTLGYSDVMPKLEWSGLGTERAICDFIDESHFIIYTSTDITNLRVNDKYTSPNEVECIVTGMRSTTDETTSVTINVVSFNFSGNKLPTLGIFTFVEGEREEGESTAGDLTANCGPMNNPITVVFTGDISGLKVNDVYSNGNVNFDIRSVDYNYNVVTVSTVSDNAVLPTSTTWNKVTSTEGPSSIASTGLYVDLKHTISDGILVSDNNVSFALYPATTPIVFNVDVDFKTGNGILSRIPFKSNKSFVATHYYVDNEQVLPNNGKDFIPFDVDSHCKKTNMNAFLYRYPIMKDANNHNLLKDSDGSIKLFYEQVDEGASRILQSVSTDGVHFMPGVVVMNVGTSLEGYNDLNNFNPCVMKDGGVYKMWFTGEGEDNVLRVLYTTSSDGLNWAAPDKVLDFTNIRLATSGNTKIQSIIKDGANFIMFFTNESNVLYKVTSADGINWNFANPTNRNGIANCSIIKESSVYRMFSLESNIPYMSISTNGIRFSKGVRLPNSNTNATVYETEEESQKETVTVNNNGISVIKDGKAYRMSVTTNQGIMISTLGCTDILNVDSTNNYYSTIGTINNAPNTNCKVVMFYESKADQTDRRLFGIDNTMENINKSAWSIVSSLDSYTNIGEDLVYRDAILNIYPQYPFDLSKGNSGSSVNTNNMVEVHDNHNDVGMITHILKDVECTDGFINDTYSTDINNIVINSGVKINCEPIINSNIYHTAPLDMTFMEMSSEIISINGMLYNVIAGNCSDDKFRFNLTMKPTRMLGNPIIK